MRRFTACHVGQILTGCTSSRTGHHLSYPAEKIYETYCYIHILTIPATDFIGWTTTSDSAGPGMPHDLNVYTRCIGWRFTARCYRKRQSFETSLTCLVFFTKLINFYPPQNPAKLRIRKMSVIFYQSKENFPVYLLLSFLKRYWVVLN